ncbi:MAG: XTP/dITP diphosphatase [Thermodesulfobacteriota bacterium]
MKKIVIATRNSGKVREIRRILEGLGVELSALDDFPALDMPPEDEPTFEGNALAKARFVAKETGLAALADDSGLEVDRLGGRPGVRSARYAGPHATDEDNRTRLLAELEGVGQDGRAARFRCAVAYVSPEGEEAVFSGTLEGSIASAPKGAGGFGYDPVFLIPERGVTAAELTADEKNAVSHRAAALRRFRLWLEEKEQAGGVS